MQKSKKEKKFFLIFLKILFETRVNYIMIPYDFNAKICGDN